MAESQQHPIEADADPQFSDYGSSIESETQSLTSSLQTYLEENGRRYHTYFGPDKNPMPTDDAEQERIDIFHEICHLCTGGQTALAPVKDNKDIQNVIDLGTGTGIWAIEIAQSNPHMNVVGLDLTPIQPSWVPPNCRFEIDDMELEWTFSQKFDYVHARFIAQCVNDWPKFLNEVKRNMNPGGYIELSEIGWYFKSDDNTLPEHYPAAIAAGLLCDAMKAVGRINPDREILRALLVDAGFTNVTMKTFKIPAGTWPKDPALKDCGGLMALACKTGYEAYLLAAGTRVLGKSPEEIKNLCRKAWESHFDRAAGVHAYIEYHVVYAQKPHDEN